ncbi:MAG TPA: C13 family peptidase [Rudaea sp.]|nr:C13 family peptidase [Rudaea sp.]
MNARRLLLTFALAFSLGVLTTVFLLQRPAQQAQIAAEPDNAKAAADPSQADSDSAAKNDPAPPEADADASSDADWPADAGSPEQLLYTQSQMMDTAVARLAARTPGRPNLYLIAFAGDGEENVFRNEAEYAEKLFSERFDAVGHTLLLINNPSTLLQYPIATLSNLQTAVDAVSERMDGEQDILLLFLTSHGSRDHELFVSLDPLPLDQIGPDDLADLFLDTKISNKVVVISACYSGGFIDALKGPATMVITAARADRTSFGCGTQSAITDFGRALLANGLNDNDNFPAAFAEARKLVDQWETRAGEEHSEPQIASTPLIESRLKAWREAIHPGPPVPFNTARPRRPSKDTSALTAAR